MAVAGQSDRASRSNSLQPYSYCIASFSLRLQQSSCRGNRSEVIRNGSFVYLQVVRTSLIHRVTILRLKNAHLLEFSSLCSCKLYYFNYVRHVILFALRNSEVSTIQNVECIHIIRQTFHSLITVRSRNVFTIRGVRLWRFHCIYM